MDCIKSGQTASYPSIPVLNAQVSGLNGKLQKQILCTATARLTSSTALLMKSLLPKVSYSPLEKALFPQTRWTLNCSAEQVIPNLGKSHAQGNAESRHED